ncbi:hypothetical protein U8335_11425 [Roseiconus lacunae]|uniref:DUF177 domain-containing protein n=1 Tax=Roseiconus lacunae TaxID=2605694 RepID=A0ABT7PBI0_9BACT|nr:hypothetical protein [Roseiconus lacunae]MCD0462309.1 hypothetical protein [Roseiconus lacunae]MDM4013806.1 hypothetical protein [Roseiconus lacunae]WRQ53114.1 hypothetical protein U8335_11425 [Stieleria sp. HD01]
MNLQFDIVSTPIECERLRESIRLAAERFDAGGTSDGRQPDVTSNESDGRLRLSLRAGETASDDCVDLDGLIEFLRHLATAVEGETVRWTIGHQLESSLGSFDERGVGTDLAIELSTAFTVAETLSDMMVDGEYQEDAFAGDDPVLPEGVVSLQDEDDWNSLESFEETFQRFPELD